ncbi:glycosyltransferase [Pseudorhodoferax sp.]|uniref:glycosyltransferase n=1 Tax=Pseudorhodoferax sp. TaxID=1993553 RepID=UPI002DD6707D|nr:glycosyltransferase [Pseudorhodoferax sp.]
MIPRTFHFVFGLKPQTEPFHLMHYLCLASCLAVERPQAVVMHYDHEPWGEWWDRIRPALQLRKAARSRLVDEFVYADRGMDRYRYAHAADFVRLQALIEQGGVYADIDTLFLQPLPQSLWARGVCVLGEERSPRPGEASYCNAWIAAPPGDRFCRAWLDEMATSFDGSWSGHSTLLPGRLAQRLPGALHVEPESAFYAFDWRPHRIDDLFLRDRPVPAGAYSLHLWNHLWWARERRDFSRFHAERLTPDYVAFAATTYARLARPFLPPDVAVDIGAWRRQRGAALAEHWRHPLRALREACRRAC